MPGHYELSFELRDAGEEEAFRLLERVGMMPFVIYRLVLGIFLFAVFL